MANSKKQLRVVFITREGYRLPGARYRAYQLAKILKGEGIQAKVISYADHLGGKDGEREREMDIWERAVLNWKAYRWLKNYPPQTVIILQRVHYHWGGPFLAHLSKKFPLIIDMDDWEFKENLGKLGLLSNSRAEMLTRFLLRHARGISVSSHFLYNFFSSYYPFYMPSAVDTETFVPLPFRPKENLTLSWIGTLHRRDNLENIEFLLPVFRKIRKSYPGVSLELVGSGYYADSVKKITEGEKGVRFLGWIEPDKMPEYLSSIDIGLLPLIQDIKFNLAKSPVKLFEYFACAKPVVASFRGEAVHFIKDGTNGFLASDEKEFTAKLEKLIVSPSLRRHMGKEARKTAENSGGKALP
ncbi:MAG: glycosyltransferase family 4 protein [Caldiserica bacterium]|nr:glycosyltransferase family 4 protein [Caldisericota bacterium]